ncbi:hypothetical protein BLA29_001548 [Euroglyphus maynei]|uniref:Uncharacterized protein n=1 Tax=Euroglyphus maynei TaxID=6958 RepID=A0A1Y3ANC8_EURMA|nr:hypothetical protein BLA29_001548 [Euroglyphus maynei]
MANIDSIRNDIGSLYEYFECNKSGNSKKTIVIALSIAICMQLIILTILFAWCFWCRKRRKKLQKNIIQNKQQWSLRGSISTSNGFKSRRNRFPLEMIRKKPPPRHSPFQSFSTVDEGSTQQTLASKLAEFDSLTAGETFGEISEKSSVSKSIKKKITAARSAKKAKLTEIVDEPIKTMAITLSDYFGKKPTAAIKKKTITTTSERRTPSPADSRSRKRKRSVDSIPCEIQKDRKAEARTKQKRREQQLIKVIKLLAKDSDDYRQHRRRLLGHNEHGDNDDDDDDSRRARTTTRQARTITRSMEATDPQVIRDLLDNLDRHRERKRQRRRQH